MVRSTHFLRIIEKEHLVKNAGKMGAYFLDQLRALQREEPRISAARGRGLFLAFDLPDPKTREEFWKGFFDLGVLTLRFWRKFDPFPSRPRYYGGSDR